MLLSKTMGFTLPLVMLVMDVYPLGRFPRESLRRLLLEKIPFIALMIASTFMIRISVEKADAFYSRAEYPLIQSLSQPGFRLCFYIGKTLLPFHLSPLYWFRPQVGWPQALGWMALLGLGAILVAQRRRHPAALATFLCFGLLIAPTSGIVQVGPQFAADRYTYVPCLPFAALASGCWLLLSERTSRRIAVGAGTALLAVLGVLTFRQCGIWKDSVSLWTRAIDLEPDVYFTRDRRGQAFVARQEWDRALADFDVSIQLNGGWFESWTHRARARLLAKNPAGAIEDATRALELRPDLGDAFQTRGLANGQLGRGREAIADFSSALRWRPEFVEARVHRATELAKLGELAQARSDLDAALSLDPEPQLYVRRATLRALQKDLEGAIADCTEAVRLKPDYADAYVSRGVARLERGDPDSAGEDFSRALRTAPATWAPRRQVEELLRQARSAPQKQ
jgi:tetratricopeptide (TPR) repeat protein